MKTHILKETRHTTLTRKTVQTAHCGVTCIILPKITPRYAIKINEEARKDMNLCRRCDLVQRGTNGWSVRSNKREPETNL